MGKSRLIVFITLILFLGVLLLKIALRNSNQKTLIKEYSELTLDSLINSLNSKNSPNKKAILLGAKTKIESESLKQFKLSSLLKFDKIFFSSFLKSDKLENEINYRIALGKFSKENLKMALSKRKNMPRKFGDIFDVNFIMARDSMITKNQDFAQICSIIDFYQKKSDEKRSESDLKEIKQILKFSQRRGIKMIKENSSISLDSLYAIRLSNLFKGEGNRLIDSIGKKKSLPLVVKSQNEKELFFLGSFQDRIANRKIINLVNSGRVRNLKRLILLYRNNPSIARKMKESLRVAELAAKRFELCRMIDDKSINQITTQIADDDSLYDESVHQALLYYAQNACDKYIRATDYNLKEGLKRWLVLSKIIQKNRDDNKNKEISKVFQRALKEKGFDCSSDQDIFRIAKKVGVQLRFSNYYMSSIDGTTWENVYVKLKTKVNE